MGRLVALLPELMLSIGGTILMMVAAFTGRRGICPGQLARSRAAACRNRRARRCAVARRTRLRRAGHRRPVRKFRQSDDLPCFRDRDHRRPRLVRTRDGARSEYAVLIVFSAVGMSVMVSATSLSRSMLVSSCKPRELRARLLPTDGRALRRGRAQIFRSRRACERHPPVRDLAALRIYGDHQLHRSCCRVRPRCADARIALRPRLHARRTGVQGQRRAVPHVDPGRLRRRADAGDRFLRDGAKVAAVLLATRVCLDALGPATDAWRQIVIFAALASIFLGAIAAYGQTNIKRLLAYSSINNVGFGSSALPAPAPPAHRGAVLPGDLRAMKVGAFLCVLWMRGAEGEPVEDIASLSGLAQTRPAFAAAIAAVHV